MRIHVNPSRCEGHGRCYTLAPELIEADDVGNGREIGDGSVPPGLEAAARMAFENCPEHAVVLDEAGS